MRRRAGWPIIHSNRADSILVLGRRSTDTGYFEEAQYRFNANASDPQCITAYVLWQHGKYQLNNNGSITLYPFGSDGRIQVQDPCAAVTNIITTYDQIVRLPPGLVRGTRHCADPRPSRLVRRPSTPTGASRSTRSSKTTSSSSTALTAPRCRPCT